LRWPSALRSIARGARPAPASGKLPHAVRFIGLWRKAQARLRGRQPCPLTNLSNRFWIGQPLLPFV